MLFADRASIEAIKAALRSVSLVEHAGLDPCIAPLDDDRLEAIAMQAITSMVMQSQGMWDLVSPIDVQYFAAHKDGTFIPLTPRGA